LGSRRLVKSKWTLTAKGKKASKVRHASVNLVALQRFGVLFGLSQVFIKAAAVCFDRHIERICVTRCGI